MDIEISNIQVLGTVNIVQIMADHVIGILAMVLSMAVIGWLPQYLSSPPRLISQQRHMENTMPRSCGNREIVNEILRKYL
jgi:hypothetical protein